MAITKPQLQTDSANMTEKASDFATPSNKNENVSKGKGDALKTAQNASKFEAKSKRKSFFAPEGDSRLTANIRTDLHKRIKRAAIEKDITVGEIIEQLIEQYIEA